MHLYLPFLMASASLRLPNRCVSRHPDGHAFSFFDLLVSKRRFDGQVGIEKTQDMLAGLLFRLDSVLHVNSFFVIELNPPPKTGFMDRLRDKLRRD